MKIQFLGTSFGAPSVGRHQQSLLLETDCGDAYLVDAGAPVLDILVRERYDLTKLKAVFITHLHGDHMNGLHDIINLAAYCSIRCEIWLPEQRGIDAFTAYTEMQIPGGNGGRTPFRLIGEGDFYDDGVLRVKSVQTGHMTGPCYGFLLEADGSSVYVTGDLHPSLEDFPVFLQEVPVDMIVTECAHFTPEALFTKIQCCLAKQVAVIHVMPEGKYAALETLAEAMPGTVLLPKDGDVYTLRKI